MEWIFIIGVLAFFIWWIFGDNGPVSQDEIDAEVAEYKQAKFKRMINDYPLPDDYPLPFGAYKFKYPVYMKRDMQAGDIYHDHPFPHSLDGQPCSRPMVEDDLRESE